MTFSLATLRSDGAAIPAIEIEGRFWPIEGLFPELKSLTADGGLLGLFRQWDRVEAMLVAALSDPAFVPNASVEPLDPAEDDFLAPLLYPSKVVLIGGNYADHVQDDAGETFNKEDNLPLLFLKPPTTSLVGSGKSVRYPTQSQKLDWELELAVVIGRGGRKIKADEAMDHVAGYTIGLDLTVRDWQMDARHLGTFDMVTGKAFDDSCPLGPKIVPKRFVDLQALDIRLTVDGELKQNGNSGNMTWTVPEIIEAVSEHITLEPGDVILTGTPAGVGFPTGTFLKVGSRLVGEITGLGKLAVEIAGDERAALPRDLAAA
ncbi:fumarylacetoacetate hydrolase family protein [Sphingobium aromaticivastans]|uniref:fumarylacetoacetate hydrolase family protein n=1 Tax=Sphingobium aromaticivastans TaxID=1778665 RepID=UPI003015BF1E